MPVVIEQRSSKSIEVDEFVERCRELKLDMYDPDALADVAPLLARLYNNRSFLAEFFNNYLEDSLLNRKKTSETGQVFSLHRIDDSHYLRMCIWPSKEDEIYVRTGHELFYYHEPHDHNFDFITLGYEGPGYDSDYWTTDARANRWCAGYPVTLAPQGRETLTPGKIMIYRKGIDIHSQLPPAQTSVTLNVICSNPVYLADPQYIFTTDMGSVAYVHHERASSSIFSAALNLEPETSVDKMIEVAERHADEAVRFTAVRSLALHPATRARGEELMDRAEVEGPELLKCLVSRYRLATSHPA